MAVAINDGSIFLGSPDKRIPVGSPAAIMMKTYQCVGWLIAISITQGGPGPSCFAPWVCEYFCHGIHRMKVQIEDVCEEVQTFLNQVKVA